MAESFSNEFKQAKPTIFANHCPLSTRPDMLQLEPLPQLACSSTNNPQEFALNRMLLSLGTATLMAISIANASAKDKQSETFLKKAIEGNFAEVSMGELAQQNGQSDAVKSYGRMLSTDHAAANQKA